MAFRAGPSIANGLPWVIPEQWKRDLIAGNAERAAHVKMIVKALREEMDRPSIHAGVYQRLLKAMATRTVDQGYHRLITTNWDYLLQREVDAWIDANQPGHAPRFLNATVYHFNGSVEPGNYENRSPFLLETDSAEFRRSTFEANQASDFLL